MVPPSRKPVVLTQDLSWLCIPHVVRLEILTAHIENWLSLTVEDCCPETRFSSLGRSSRRFGNLAFVRPKRNSRKNGALGNFAVFRACSALPSALQLVVNRVLANGMLFEAAGASFPDCGRVAANLK
jgi:hypothetical protein